MSASVLPPRYYSPSYEADFPLADQVENKDRVGVCIDTCHAFAAGYDMRTRETYEATVKVSEECL